ncbi:HAD-IIB family hydrolase [Moritella sp.]|uniref:HAD-IIB family hydrolase n=1 Tax=Moritella sp. TaxID=78556 RepID=UPI0025DCD36D|nr:HAD-IIB family hydrolase [Moritella sp.]MCJ8352186.1 HAD-IIB family hydrolase [Moritella sp.]
MMTNPQLTAFIKRNTLDTSYLADAAKWYSALISAIRSHQYSALAQTVTNAEHSHNKQTPVLLGINGCQGSGKSTLADYLATYLTSEYKMNVAVLSLDDFYYSHQQRKNLSVHEHHLLQTRGVPGTHNLSLAHDTLDKLQSANNKSAPVALPRFNKTTDNPYPESEWPVIYGAVDVIILEGWCLGVQAQTEEALFEPVNSLEATKDKYGVWRRYVNNQIKHHYAALYERLDMLVMLKAPSFDTVYQWRLAQELKLKQQALTLSTPLERVMTESEIKLFTAYFQRLTEHGLTTLPTLCNWVFELDTHRNIVHSYCPQSIQLDHYPTIFTDLDGTLLDHDNYSFTPALTTLAELKRAAIPVIPNTSKTYVELVELRRILDLHGPFIVENGAAVYIPVNYFSHQPIGTIQQDGYWVKSLVHLREHWLSLLPTVPVELTALFTNMNNMTVNDIVNATGLDAASATLASQRQYGEPVLWHGNAAQKQLFIQHLNKQGATVLEGGRFLHVCGNCNKGKAMDWLMEQFKFFNPQQTPYSIALGDGNNDIAMLEAAQYAAIISSPVHIPPKLKRKQRLITSKNTGPTGWAEVLAKLLPQVLSELSPRLLPNVVPIMLPELEQTTA